MQYQNTDNVTNEKPYSLPKTLPLETPFWSFSLSIWGNADAQTALLALQDEQGLQINHLLFAIWLGAERREMSVDELIEDPLLSWWHAQTVSTLRELRKQLSTSAPFHPQLKKTVQNAEFQAEQIEQALLFKQFEQLSVPTTKRNTLETLAINLLSYTQKSLNEPQQASHAAAVRTHLVTLVHAATPSHDRSHIDLHFPGS